MKKIIITFISVLVFASLSLTACNSIPQTTLLPTKAVQSDSDLIKVLAIESFLADIAQNVAGDRLRVETLIPIGTDPHAFEPTPQDVAKIADSQVLIANGAGLEEWLAKMVTNVGGERTIIEAAAGLTSREGEEAVMSPEEKSESICTQLGELTAEEEIMTGADVANAVEMHTEHKTEAAESENEAELLNLRLNPAADGGYLGYVQFDVATDGEYTIVSNVDTVTVTGASGMVLDAKDILSVNCLGLSKAISLDLEPGAYIICLSSSANETTPFFAGSAGGHHHHDGDPHFWLDPLSVVKYVENICDGLIATDPAGKETYTQNAIVYTNQLKELNTWIEQQVSTIPEDRRLIVTNHESFGYFADRYGFKIIGTIIPSVSTGASPSAQQLARLVDHIRETGAPAIFLETGSNPQLAEQVARETGVKVVDELYTHSITGSDGNAPNYIDMMKYNVNAIVEALK